MTKKQLKEFEANELCLVGDGYKYHIRGRGAFTLCFHGSMIDIEPGLIRVREDCEDMCKNCLKIYHKLEKVNEHK